MLKLKSIIILSIMISLTLAMVSAQNETVTNSHNSDINDPKYVNPNDYYIDENRSQVTCAYDTVCFNNVSMSNGYNAYAIQDRGHIETNDSKTHQSFWNDTFHVVDTNDTDAVAGHWHHTGNIQWLSETTYCIIDFLAFRNSNQFHKDLWGFKFQLFNKTIDNQSNVTSNSNSSSLKKNSTNDNQSEIANEKSDQSRNKTLNISSVKNRTDNISLKYQNKKFQIDSKETGNPTNLLVILIFILCLFLVRHIMKRI